MSSIASSPESGASGTSGKRGFRLAHLVGSPWFWVAFALNGPIVLTAHSLIMAWLWRYTAGSLPMAMLYHLTITASAMLAPIPGTGGSASLIHAGIGAALTWLAAVTLLATRRREWAWHR